MKTHDVAIGSIYAAISRIAIILSAFAIHIVLARRLGPELFGLYTLIMSMLVWVESTASLGLPTVFRKMISEDRGMLRPIVTSMNPLSLPYVGALTLVVVLLAPVVAFLMQDSRLIVLLMIAASDISVFGIYSSYQAVLNGHGEFLKHSLVATFYALCRAIAIIGAVLVGFGIAGALVGNTIASALGLWLTYFIAHRLIQSDAPENDNGLRLNTPTIRNRLVSFGLPYISSTMLTAGLMNLDIWFLKAMTGYSGADGELVGYYAAAYNFTRIPSMLMVAITVTMFPAISKAVHERRRADARHTIQHILHVALMILVPMSVVVYATADRILVLLFSAEYLPGTRALQILFGGVVVFTVFLFFMNIIAAENRPMQSLWIATGLVPVGVASNYYFILWQGIEGAAIATTLVALLGLFVAGTFVWGRFGRVVCPRSALRLLLICVVMYAAASYDSLYEIHLLIGYVVLLAIYLGMLLVVGEIDFTTVRSVALSVIRRRGVVR